MIEVLNPGIHTTIQASRRIGFQKAGFPGSGPLDSLSMFGANYLTDQNMWSACFEMILTGPTIKFHQQLQIAICGADMNPTLNGIPISQDLLTSVRSGDVLKFGAASKGRVTYLSVNGEIMATNFLGSFSTYSLAKKGGYKGRALIKGDFIEVKKVKECPYRIIPNLLKYVYQPRNNIRLLEGPEYENFSKEQVEIFIRSAFRITGDSNRIGIRLTSDSPLMDHNSEIISSAILPGTIQIPKNGFPIVMMYDHQTTGGYARLANVISHDLDFIAQCDQSCEIIFRFTSLEKSQVILNKRTKQIHSIFKNRSI